MIGRCDWHDWTGPINVSPVRGESLCRDCKRIAEREADHTR